MSIIISLIVTLCEIKIVLFTELILTSTNLVDLKRWKFEETKYVHSCESSSGRGSSNGISGYYEDIEENNYGNGIYHPGKVYNTDYYTIINYNAKLMKKHEYLNTNIN